ncbi:MAG: DUF2604 domain-containing protein [Sediminibacterium sp.]|nr:DUF2604 domain-containing protein [Sediminibacterium sp.]
MITEIEKKEKEKNKDGDKKIILTVIVSGTPTTVEANPHQKLQVVAQKALEQTGNTSRPLSDWTIKTREGVVLDMKNTVESYGLKDGSQLVMSLEAGVGG